MANNQQLLLGEGAGSAPAVYIEDVFSTYLYTGTGAALTITNNIDLSTKGGLTWIKGRSGTTGHRLTDTARGVTKSLASDSTAAEATETTGLTAFGTTGFTIGADADYNTSAATYVSWTFRKQPKFFDVVTYTGNGSSQNIAHNLGSVPGCIIIKRTDTTSNWGVVARTTGTTYAYFTGSSNGLNVTAAAGGTLDFSTAITATYFEPSYLQDTGGDLNTNGGTYVAYLFAHNAGGFGLTGTDNVISCGSFTTDGSGKATVNLGYEPQWLLLKNTNGTNADWVLMDTMRGWTANTSSSEASLYPNLSAAETIQSFGSPTATGFNASGWYATQTIIYIAIRRSPMKVPTVGTSVFSPVARTGTGATAQITGIGFTPDFIIGKPRTGYSVGTAEFDRLKGTTTYLAPSWTDAETSDSTMVTSFNMDGVSLGADTTERYFNGSAGTYANWLFCRAPGFFDEVCYTGGGYGTVSTFSHNLTVAPEFMIVKQRGPSNQSWQCYHSGLGATKFILLNSDGIGGTSALYWNNTAPTSAVFTVTGGTNIDASANTYVNYLFATCAGVSKVGSYTGNGSSQTIACGFTAGSRFVLIKRTDSTGDWYVWDSARGIIAGNDPHLSLNTTADEVTTDDSVDTDNSGFIVNQDSATNVNVTSATYIFLAIA